MDYDEAPLSPEIVAEYVPEVIEEPFEGMRPLPLLLTFPHPSTRLKPAKRGNKAFVRLS